jgi:enoyl-CoA hydratase
MPETTDGESILYETPAPHVARLVLNRPERRNAQDKALLYELNDALDRAAHDDDVRVIILAANGPHFSSGHDLSDRRKMTEFVPVSCWGGYRAAGAEGHMAIEEELFLGLCWRWRNLPKPTIAQVQGKVIAGGLMLVWPFDLIVASEDAQFSDPVVAAGVNGVEYFAHPWELGPRKAKEILFTGGALTAREAAQSGMVNHVVARDELEPFTLALAVRIASRPTMAVKLAKQSVNQALDAQGFWPALQAAMSLHQLAHSHNQQVFGSLLDPAGPETMRREAKAQT